MNKATSDKTSDIKLTQVRSTAGQLKSIIGSVRGLGLRGIRHSVTVKGTPENRGMINSAQHLLKVEESK